MKSRFDAKVTMEQWVKAKQTLQLNPELSKKKYEESGNDTVELIAGFKDRKYA